MVATKAKKILAALNIATLLAGTGIMVEGCTSDANKDEPPADAVQKDSEKSATQSDPVHKPGEPGPATGKKIRGTSG